jgi:hypothetical protein
LYVLGTKNATIRSELQALVLSHAR